MTKKVKIALALGTTAVLAVVGFVVYNRMSKTESTARKYLDDVDDNGGNPPVSKPTVVNPRTAITRNLRPVIQKQTASRG